MESGRENLIEVLKVEGIANPIVLAALGKVDRAKFVPETLQAYAYVDEALPIKENQTISQPFVVARMTEAVLGEKSQLKNVLEVGTGSGYQSAILANLADEVYTIERIEELYEEVSQRLLQLGYKNIHTAYGDGYLGWPEYAPYDAILVTAAASEVPQELLAQLDPLGGRMIIPVETKKGWQVLQLITRNHEDYTVENFDAVTFVPLLPGLKNRP